MTDLPEARESRRIPLPPRARKLIAFGILAAGAWFILRLADPVTPREVELRVGLGNFRDGMATARAAGLTITLARGGETVRALSAHFGPGGAPAEWRATISIPPGDYLATVTVDEPGRAVARTSNVHLAPDRPASIPAPLPE